jgi:hypothetical protein
MSCTACDNTGRIQPADNNSGNLCWKCTGKPDVRVAAEAAYNAHCASQSKGDPFPTFDQVGKTVQSEWTLVAQTILDLFH